MEVRKIQKKVEDSIQLQIDIAKLDEEMKMLEASIKYMTDVNATFDKYLDEKTRDSHLKVSSTGINK